MNNFELLDKWCETCLDYINPLLWKEIQSRGLVNIVNYLPSNIEEAKVEVGRRMRDFENQKIKILERIEQQQKQECERRNFKRDSAVQFYSKYNIPFKFDIGQKEVLSGLSVNSWGDGQKQNTVQHILVLQEFVNGRFGRKSGDFLCTSKNGSNGENWSGQALLIRHTDGNGTGYMPEPTCKQCLKILSKYKI